MGNLLRADEDMMIWTDYLHDINPFVLVFPICIVFYLLLDWLVVDCRRSMLSLVYSNPFFLFSDPWVINGLNRVSICNGWMDSVGAEAWKQERYQRAVLW